MARNTSAKASARLGPQPVDPALLATLRAQLDEDERLAWAASPDPEALVPEPRGSTKWDALAILGGGYAALGAGVMAVRTGRSLWLIVLLGVIACGGLAYLVTRWFSQRELRAIAGTVYACTTRRAWLIRTYPALAVQSVALDAISQINLLDPRADVADLSLQTESGSTSLLFRGVVRPERARQQLMRVIRDPQAAEQELAASEAYAMQMRRLVAGSPPR